MLDLQKFNHKLLSPEDVFATIQRAKKNENKLYWHSLEPVLVAASAPPSNQISCVTCKEVFSVSNISRLASGQVGGGLVQRRSSP